MNKKTLIIIAFFILWGILSRTVFHLGTNVEFVTAISISSGILLKGRKIAFLIPLVIMFISDIFLGTTNIFLFTWTGFLFPVLMGSMIVKFIKTVKNKKYLKLGGISLAAGISSSIFFYIWTNFGHWLTTNMYAKDLNGLIDCYINALPFLKPQMAGNLIFVPIFILATFFILSYKRNINKHLLGA